MPLIVSTHPRTQKKLDETETLLHERVKLLKPLGYLDYAKLQISAKVVISDSGTISEESSILNFPAVSLRKSIERPEALDTGTISLTGDGIKDFLCTIKIATLKRNSEMQIKSEQLEVSF